MDDRRRYEASELASYMHDLRVRCERRRCSRRVGCRAGIWQVQGDDERCLPRLQMYKKSDWDKSRQIRMVSGCGKGEIYELRRGRRVDDRRRLWGRMSERVERRRISAR